MKLYNITFKLDDLRTELIPCIPETAGEGENTTIKRVCFADSVPNAMTGISVARRNIAIGVRFLARVIDVDTKDKNVISPKMLKKNNFVPDALEHNEYWYLDKAKCKVYLCEIGEFDYDFELAWSCISAEQVRNMIKGYGENFWIPSLERYKSSEACYNTYMKMASNRGWWSVVDSLWDDLSMLPWAQTVKITDFDFKILKQLK